MEFFDDLLEDLGYGKAILRLDLFEPRQKPLLAKVPHRGLVPLPVQKVPRFLTALKDLPGRGGTRMNADAFGQIHRSRLRWTRRVYQTGVWRTSQLLASQTTS